MDVAADVAAVIASIPSPSSGSIDIGPIVLNAYGLMIALGVVAGGVAVRTPARGEGARGRARTPAPSRSGRCSPAWSAPGCTTSLTDWERFEDDLGDIPKIWEGGLGIPGGMLAGVLVGVWVARRRGIGTVRRRWRRRRRRCRWPRPSGAGATGSTRSCTAGRPTCRGHSRSTTSTCRPGYPPGTTFHPTFLYESLWNFGLCGLLLWIDKRYRMTGGQLMAVYVAGYGVGRFWIEGLRIDPANEIGPFRWNQWVAIACVVGGVGFLDLPGPEPGARRAPSRSPPATRTSRSTRRRGRRPTRERRRARLDEMTCRRSDEVEDDGRRRAPPTRRRHESRAPVAESNRCRRSGRGTRLSRSPFCVELRPSAPGDDLGGGRVGLVLGAVEERLRAELLDHDDADVEPAGARPAPRPRGARR